MPSYARLALLALLTLAVHVGSAPIPESADGALLPRVLEENLLEARDSDVDLVERSKTVAKKAKAAPKPQNVATPKPKKVAAPKPKKVAAAKPKKVVAAKPKKVVAAKPKKVVAAKPKKVVAAKPKKAAVPKKAATTSKKTKVPAKTAVKGAKTPKAPAKSTKTPATTKAAATSCKIKRGNGQSQPSQCEPVTPTILTSAEAKSHMNIDLAGKEFSLTKNSKQGALAFTYRGSGVFAKTPKSEPLTEFDEEVANTQKVSKAAGGLFVASGIDTATSSPWLVTKALSGSELQETSAFKSAKAAGADACKALVSKATALVVAKVKTIFDASGVAHDDLNPGNLLFNDAVTSVNLIDFGFVTSKFNEARVQGQAEGQLEKLC